MWYQTRMKPAHGTWLEWSILSYQSRPSWLADEISKEENYGLDLKVDTWKFCVLEYGEFEMANTRITFLVKESMLQFNAVKAQRLLPIGTWELTRRCD